MDRLKIRDMKQRHSQKMQGWKLPERKQRHQNAGIETARNGNCGTMLHGWKMRHKPLWTAKRTLRTTLVNFSVVVGSPQLYNTTI